MDPVASIVRVFAAETKKRLGAGFFVGPRRVVTCAHVVAGASTVIVEIAGSHERILAHVSDDPAPSEQADLALLVCEPIRGNHPPAVLLGYSNGSYDHRFRIWGFPTDAPDGTWVRGSIGGLKHPADSDFHLIQLDETDVREGFSGSAVYDEQTRRVIGVARWRANPGSEGPPIRSGDATPTELVRAWYRALTASADCPYRDLASFRASDEKYWHGRGALLDSLMAKIATLPRFLTVVGASGTGKSSLLHAGLVATLASGAALAGVTRWDVRTLRPGLDPFAALERAGLAGASGVEGGWTLRAAVENWQSEAAPAAARLVLVIDQFEDSLLRLREAEHNRQKSFLAQLLELGDAPVRCTVVVGLREGFESRLEELAPALADKLMAVRVEMPRVLTRSEIVEIIEKPAQAIGLRFDPPTLPAVIANALIKEFSTDDRSSARSTALPALEVALTQLWMSVPAGGAIAWDADADAGNLTRSLARWAEQVYADGAGDQDRAWTARERAIADRILVELVQFGEAQDGRDDKGRRVRLSELQRRLADTADLQVVLDRLVTGRLLVMDREGEAPDAVVIELIHDELFRRWDHFVQLRSRSRRFARWHDWMRITAERWRPDDRRGDRDVDRLLRGDDLRDASAKLEEHAADVDPRVVRFVTASTAQAAVEYRRRGRRWFAGIAAALIAAVATTAVFVALWRRSVDAEKRAQLALERAEESARTNAARRASLLSRQLGQEADALVEAITVASDWPTGDGSRAPDALLGALADSIAAAQSSVDLVVPGEHVLAAGVSPDTRFAVLRSSDAAALNTSLWELGGGGRLAVVDTRTFCRPIHFGVPGVAGADAAACPPEAMILDLIHPALLHAVAFHPRDSALWVGHADGTVERWRGDRPTTTLADAHSAEVVALSFDAQGDSLLSVGHDGSAVVWDVQTRRPRGPPLELGEPAVNGKLAPDGRTAVVVGRTRVCMFRTGSDTCLPLDEVVSEMPGPVADDTAPCRSLAFSADSELAALGCQIASANSRLVVWRVGEGTLLKVFAPEAGETGHFSTPLFTTALGCTGSPSEWAASATAIFGYDTAQSGRRAFSLCAEGAELEEDRSDVSGEWDDEEQRAELARQVLNLRVLHDGSRAWNVSDDIHPWSVGHAFDHRVLVHLSMFQPGDPPWFGVPSRDGSVLLVQDQGDRLLRLASPPPPQAYAGRSLVSPGGRWLLEHDGPRGVIVAHDADHAMAPHDLAPCAGPNARDWFGTFTTDQRMVMLACAGRMSVWSLNDDGTSPLGDIAVRDYLDPRYPYLRGAFSGDGSRLVVYGARDRAGLVSLPTRAPLAIDDGVLLGVGPSITAGIDHYVVPVGSGSQYQLRVRDLANGALRCETRAGRVGLSALQSSADGRYLLGEELGGAIVVWRASDCGVSREIQAASRLRSIRFTPDGSRIVVVSTNNEDSAIWQTAGSAPPVSLPTGLNPMAVAVSADSEHVWLGEGYGSSVFEIALATGHVLRTFTAAGRPGVGSILRAPDGSTVATTASAAVVLHEEGQRGVIHGVHGEPVFSSDGELLAMHGDGSLVIARVGDGQPLVALRGMPHDPRRIAFLGSGSDRVSVEGNDRTVVLTLRSDELMAEACGLLRRREQYARVRSICDRDDVELERSAP